MNKLKRLFAPPIFEDAQKTQDAQLLNFVTLAYLSALLLGLLGLIPFTYELGPSFVITGLIRRLGLLFLVSIATQVLLRRGHVRSAGYVYVYGMVLAFAILIIFNGGVQSTAFPNAIMVILTAGLILGWRTAAITTTVIIITAFISLILETQGMLPTPIAIGNNSMEGLSTSAILIISTILLSLFIKGRDKTSSEAKKANASLKEASELLKQQVQQLTASFEVSRKLSTLTDMDQLIRAIVEQIQTVFAYYYVQLYLFDANKENLILVSGTGEAGQQMLANKHRLIKDQGLVGQAATTNKPVLISDVAQDIRWLPNPLLPETKAETAVPISIGSDVLGVLDVQHNLVGEMDEASADLLQSVANQIAIAIQNARQVEQTKAALAETSLQADRLRTLNDMSHTLNNAQNVNDVYKAVGHFTQKIVGGQRASLAIIDPDSKTFEVMGLSGEQGVIPMGTHLPLDKTMVGLCIRENRLIINANGQPDNYLDTKKLAEQGIISTMSVPLIIGGKTTGTLNIGSNQANAFGTREKALLQQTVSLFSSALENRQLLAQTQEALQETSIFRQLVENAGQGIGMATLDGSILYVNQTLAALLGINALEDPISKPFLHYYPEEIQARFQQEVFPALMEHGSWHGELQLQIHEKVVPTAENYFLLHDETGQPFQIGAIISDISERKRDEALIAKQTADLQTVAELSTAVSTQLDTKKLLQDIVNRTKDSFNLYHVHIYLLDETGSTLQLAAGSGDVGAEMVAAGHSIAYQHKNSLVARAARSKQGIIVNDVTVDSGFLPNPLLPHTQSEMAVPMMSGNEMIGVLDIQADTTGYFTNADINIQTTLASQIAISLKNTHAFEQASEQAAIIQNTTSIIAAFSLDGTFRFLNEAGLRRLGYDTLEDVIGQNISILYPPSPGDTRREAVTKIVQEQGVWQGEAVLVTRSGEQFPVEQTITLSYDEEGQPKMLAFNMTDITVRKQAEEAQQALNIELEEQLERVNALQRAMTREGWRAFMTTKERPFQGFEFNQEGVKTLTAQDLVSSGNGKSDTATVNRDAECVNPVIIHGAAIGKIGIRNPNGEPLSEEQQQLLADFTNQVGEALDRARLFEETELGRQAIEQQAAELATVNEISELTRSYLQLGELITAVGDHLLKTFQAHSVYIALFDDQTDIITLPYFYDKENGHHTVAPYPLQDGGFTAQVIQSREPLLINSTSSEEALQKVEEKGGKLVGSGRMTDTFVVVPMVVGAAVVGVIGISSYREIKTYDEDDKNLLITLSATIGIAIRNAQQFEAAQRRANREALVNSISQKIQGSLTIEAAMQTAVAELGKALHIRKAAVALKSDPQNSGT